MINKTPEMQNYNGRVLSVKPSDVLVIPKIVHIRSTDIGIKGQGNYDSHAPLDLGHVPGVHFYVGAEFDPQLKEMLFVCGKKIRTFRMSLNLSAEAVGEFLGLGQKAYSKIESGETRRTSLARIALLSVLFKESPLELAINENDGERAMEVIESIRIDSGVLDKIRAKVKHAGNRRCLAKNNGS
jgi:transcriptional regulator with XRE-family HTH domain